MPSTCLGVETIQTEAQGTHAYTAVTQVAQADSALQAPEEQVGNYQVTLSKTGVRVHFSRENDGSVICIFIGILSQEWQQ